MGQACTLNKTPVKYLVDEKPKRKRVMKQQLFLNENAEELFQEIKRLKEENEYLRRYIEERDSIKRFDEIIKNPACSTVRVFPEINSIFKRAENHVAEFFNAQTWNPKHASIQIHGDRYIMVRGPSLTVELFKLINGIFQDEKKATKFVRDLLFDLAHNIGKSDAINFLKKTQVTDAVERLSAGPVMFAFTGWAFVDISKESTPIPEADKYTLIYDHPYSFEADSYVRAGIKTCAPICSMNCGFSSGWCEEAFGVKLVAKEILCKARGDHTCRFIQAHPDRINSVIRDYQKRHPEVQNLFIESAIPGFFERRTLNDTQQKKIIEERNKAIEALDALQHQNNLLARERQKVFDLLKNILPEKIASKMANGEEVSAEKRNATILFADVVGFTQTSSKLKPEEVVTWLETIFMELDKLTDKYKIEKIKTIGDAYMCAAGIPDEREDHTETLAKFALETQQKLLQIKVPHTNSAVQMRIGMHTGSVVCGVLGGKKYLFDVWGDTVNVASRMESHGVAGKIHVTQQVYDILKHKYNFESREMINVKGKGLLQTYFLLGPKT